ncbi:uncharacterized protein LOC122254021 isoform X1 [Penaeus japonicus]|uniref:uncharacterized protein LOC122254021 isoform X1 n=1 Tax=Penaeus japonicus TaxID=27405 RepID=UPI001C70BD15|nr:uncharacterized protein LOC122254021 isoform X1 [Penaeus japonicus]
MAASLARSSVGEEAGGKKKSSSLPRNTPQAANSGVAPELLVILDKRRSTITNNQLEMPPVVRFQTPQASALKEKIPAEVWAIRPSVNHRASGRIGKAEVRGEIVIQGAGGDVGGR